MHYVGVLCPVFQKKLTHVQATNYFHCQDPIAKDMLINAFGLEICICDSHSIRKSYFRLHIQSYYRSVNRTHQSIWKEILQLWKNLGKLDFEWKH